MNFKIFKNINYKIFPSVFLILFTFCFVFIFMQMDGDVQAASKCPGKSERLKIRFSGDYPTRLKFKDNFKLAAQKSLGESKKLEFTHDKGNLAVLLSHFPKKSPLKIDQLYEISRVFFSSPGGILQRFTISDKDGVVITYSNTPGNPHFSGLKVSAKPTKTCKYKSKKSASTQAQAEFKYNKKSLIKLYAGSSGTVTINKKKYLISVIKSSAHRKVSKKISFEGFKSRVSYYVVKQ